MTRIVAQEEDIGLVAWRILVGLNLVSDATQTELVEFTRTEQAQLSRVLKDMETRGLISSGTDPADRRAKIFRLTDRGRGKHLALLPQITELTEAMDGALSADERKQFLSMCERIAKTSQQVGSNRQSMADPVFGSRSEGSMEVTE